MRTRTTSAPADSVIDEDRDELEDFIGEESAKDPGFAAALAEAKRRTEVFLELVRLRQASGLSQVKVAKLMSTTQSAVSDLERNTPDVLLSTLQRYARAVGVSIDVRIVVDADADSVPAEQPVPAEGSEPQAHRLGERLPTRVAHSIMPRTPPPAPLACHHASPPPCGSQP